MSHFSVLVVSDLYPSQEVLDNLLAPYHEFECTGEDNEYVQDIDQTEEAKKQYESDTTRMFKDLEGHLHDPYSDHFYREPTAEEIEICRPMLGSGCSKNVSYTSKDWGDGKGYRAKVHFMPEGWEEVRGNVKEVQDFATYVKEYYGHPVLFEGCEKLDEHKYGWCLVDKDRNVLQVIDRTNPGKKWDWWSIGGRYSGKFIAKEKEQAATGTRSWTNERDVIEGTDICQKSNLDISAMKTERMQKRAKEYETFISKFQTEFPGLTEDDLINSIRFKEKQYAEWELLPQEKRIRRWDFIKNQCETLNKDYKLIEFVGGYGWDHIKLGHMDLNQWIFAAPPLTSLAVLMNGKWYESGEMGWWGMSTNNDDDWESKFEELLNSIPSDSWLTIVDCHI